MTFSKNKGALLMALFGLTGAACERPTHAADLPKPAVDLPATKGAQTAVFAGGCFWCTEAVFDQLDGIVDVVSGYAGGTKETANYEAVCTGRTGHAEVIQITYDPTRVTYAQLLKVFFTLHDPTTLNRQGPDSGTQYRSAIFYQSEEEKKVAEAYIKQLNESGAYPDKIVTTLEPLKEFFLAEAYHQNYTALNPQSGYIQGVALPKVEKVREKFKDQLKKPATQPS